MKTAMLSIVAPAVYESVFGDWLVDDGSLVPVRARSYERAFDEAAARPSLTSRIAGTNNPFLLGRTAPACGAGSSHPLAPGEADVRLADGEALAGRREPASDDEVPGPAAQPPVRGGSGTTNASAALLRDVRAATAVGVAALAEAAP
jgi:hypothetical protein